MRLICCNVSKCFSHKLLFCIRSHDQRLLDSTIVYIKDVSQKHAVSNEDCRKTATLQLAYKVVGNRNGGYCAGFRAQLADVEVFQSSQKLIVVPERWFFANSHAIRKCK